MFLALIIGKISAAAVGYLVGLIALRRTVVYFCHDHSGNSRLLLFLHQVNPLATSPSNRRRSPWSVRSIRACHTLASRPARRCMSPRVCSSSAS